MNQPASKARRVLVIGADGLRPDLIDPVLMPTLTGLAAAGVYFPDHHAVFPTHTRVNISTLATGVGPGRHGIVANTMLVPSARQDHIIDTGDDQHLEALAAARDGQALWVPSLGDILAAHGARLAIRRPMGEPGVATEEIIEPETSATVALPARLQLHRVGGTTYLHGALQPDAVFERPHHTR